MLKEWNGIKLNLQFFAENPVDSGGNPIITGDGDDGKGDDGKGDDGKGEEKNKEKTFTQAEVDELINSRFKRAEDDKKKAIDEAKKLAQMNAEQKREYEFEQMKKENEELKQLKDNYTLGKEASKMLEEKNIIANDDILNMVVGADADETSQRVQSFIDTVNKVVSSQVHDKLKGTPPKRQQISGGGLTRESISKIKDSAERIKAIRENPSLFE